MKQFVTLAFVYFCLASTAACQSSRSVNSTIAERAIASSATPAPKQIVGGVGIDKIQIGDMLETAIRRMGPPDEEYHYNYSPECTRVELQWLLRGEPYRSIFGYFKNDHAFQIIVGSQEYSTQSGIRVESSASNILAKLDSSFEAFVASNTGDKINGGRDLIYLVSKSGGIAYEMYFDSRINARRVANIIIFSSGTEMIPTGCQPEWQKMISIDIREVLSR